MFVVIVLWIGFFVINFNVAMMSSLLPFMARDLAASPAESGMALAAFPLVALLANLALGPFIDRLGRKPFIVTGAFGCAVMLLVTAAGGNATAIVLGRAATGLFMPMIGASIFSAIADYFPLTERTRIGGYVASAAPIAFLAAMSLGMVLGGLLSWRLSLVLLAIVCLALGLLASAMPRIAGTGAPIGLRGYAERLSAFSADFGTRLLLSCYFAWSVGLYVFLGLYPSWLLQHGLADGGVGAIGLVLLLGEIGGLFGALLCGRLAALVRHPLSLCAGAALVLALVVAVIPLGMAGAAFQVIAYGIFAFGRDLMLALILGGAMSRVAPARRGSLNASLNAVYQSGASLGGYAGARLYGRRPDFGANAAIAAVMFVVSAGMLWRITRIDARQAFDSAEETATSTAAG